jgi:hypothetical protein
MKDALRNYYKKQADQTAMSAVAANYHNRIRELERLTQDPDPFVRDRAEQEIQTAKDHIKLDMDAVG